MEEALDLLYSRANDTEVMNYLIRNASGLNIQDHLYLNIFHHLVITNRSEIIMGLISFYDISMFAQKDLCGKTALVFLARKGGHKIIEKILAIENNLSKVKDNQGRTI